MTAPGCPGCQVRLRCLNLRPETADLIKLLESKNRLLIAGATTSLRDLARRWKALDDEVNTLNRQIDLRVRSASPGLIELHGVGVEIAGQFLVTAGGQS